MESPFLLLNTLPTTGNLDAIKGLYSPLNWKGAGSTPTYNALCENLFTSLS